MSEAVTDLIVSRARQPEGLGRMVAWSLAAHAAVVAVVTLMPDRSSEEAPRTVMTISLGGAPGPRSGGLTEMGGRPVQAATPEPPRIATAPAPTRPAMALPDPKARTRAERPRPDRAPPQANAPSLSTGEQPREGSTPTETRVRGQGFGLSSSGGFGDSVTVDAIDFCCPEYLETMKTMIQRNWVPNQGVIGTTVMKFTIRRNGQLEEIQIEVPSGFIKLDLASARALDLVRQLPGLPPKYPNPTLTVHMKFEYQR